MRGGQRHRGQEQHHREQQQQQQQHRPQHQQPSSLPAAEVAAAPKPSVDCASASTAFWAAIASVSGCNRHCMRGC